MPFLPHHCCKSTRAPTAKQHHSCTPTLAGAQALAPHVHVAGRLYYPAAAPPALTTLARLRTLPARVCSTCFWFPHRLYAKGSCACACGQRSAGRCCCAAGHGRWHGCERANAHAARGSGRPARARPARAQASPTSYFSRRATP